MPTTDPPPQKRTRFSDQEADTESTPPRPPPSVAARNYVTASVRSLPDSVQKYIVALSTSYHKLKNKERQQNKNLARFDNEDFIPRSARIGFELKGSESVMETEQFKTLATSTTTEVQKLQATLRTNMSKALKLEIAHTEALILKTFFKGVKELGSIFYLLQHPNTTSDKVPTNALARYILEKQRGSLFKYITIDDNNKFQKYLESAQDEVVYAAGATPNNCITPFAKVSETIQPVLEDIYVKSWETLVHDIDNRAVINKIAQQIKEFEIDRATQETAMQIDTEQALNHATISNLIQEEVSKNVKQLKKDISQLGQTIVRNLNSTQKNPKNKPRGAKTSAPITKKSQSINQTKKQNQRRRNPNRTGSAEEVDSVSSNGNRSNNKKKTRGKGNNMKKKPKTNSRK